MVRAGILYQAMETVRTLKYDEKRKMKKTATIEGRKSSQSKSIGSLQYQTFTSLSIRRLVRFK